jgi:hypothetical protein
VVIRALPLAFVAGLYPLGLAIVLRYLGEPASMRRALAYLAGAATVTLCTGLAILVSFRLFGMTGRPERTPSAALDLFVGSVLLLVAIWAGRRHASSRQPRAQPREPPPGAGDETPPGSAGTRRAMSTRAVFLLGIVTYLPSALYVAAIRDLADARLGLGPTILAVVVCTTLVLHMVEIPIVLRLCAPRRAGALLAAYNDWMHRHGWTVLVVATTAGGLYFLVNGVVLLLVG